MTNPRLAGPGASPPVSACWAFLEIDDPWDAANMAHHDDSVSLRQMLDHAREAFDLVQRRDRADLDRDRVLSLALVQLCQIIGEAASASSSLD